MGTLSQEGPPDIHVEEMDAYRFFPTLTADVRFKVPSTEPHSPRSPGVLEFLNKKPKEVPGTLPPVKLPKPHETYQAELIQEAADNVIKGKPIDLQDPFFVSSVIEELTSRQIELLIDGEYLKAQAIIDKIAELRRHFREHDQIVFRQNHIEELRQRVKDSEILIKEKKREIKAREAALLEEQKNEVAILEDSQETTRARLETEWMDPGKQRLFNKQSPALLQNRALEIHSVLAGELALAEELKRENRQMERAEASVGARKMQAAFESAQARLEADLAEQRQQLLDTHQRALDLLRANGETELERVVAKSALTAKMLREELRQQPKMVARGSALPMVNKTVENCSAKNRMKMAATTKGLAPLPLPPLVVKRKPQRKRIHSTLS